MPACARNRRASYKTVPRQPVADFGGPDPLFSSCAGWLLWQTYLSLAKVAKDPPPKLLPARRIPLFSLDDHDNILSFIVRLAPENSSVAIEIYELRVLS
jgi:hypothetical protein